MSGVLAAVAFLLGVCGGLSFGYLRGYHLGYSDGWRRGHRVGAERRQLIVRRVTL